MNSPPRARLRGAYSRFEELQWAHLMQMEDIHLVVSISGSHCAQETETETRRPAEDGMLMLLNDRQHFYLGTGTS